MTVSDMRLLSDLSAWDQASAAERQRTVRFAIQSLPSEWVFIDIGRYKQGASTHEIAVFRFQESEFALIPGQNPAILGYDRSSPFEPTPPMAADWESSIEAEFGLTFQDALDDCLTPLRRVTILPLLVEVTARSAAYDQMGLGDEGRYAQILAACGDEFRLPNADEWEYLCAGGTRSLFRWGNECPISCSHTERNWDAHRQPNSFGLLMNPDTYQVEICEGPTFRGGDGGGFVCGGIGKVATWLPLASSFTNSDDEVKGWCIEEVLIRRVRTVAPDSRD